jgi:hypothetical protein
MKSIASAFLHWPFRVVGEIIMMGQSCDLTILHTSQEIYLKSTFYAKTITVGWQANEVVPRISLKNEAINH